MISSSLVLRAGQLWSMTFPFDHHCIDYILLILHPVEDPRDNIFRVQAIEKSSDGHERVVVVQPPRWIEDWHSMGYKRLA